jgi:membrane protease YdiL (CAAX protease family)
MSQSPLKAFSQKVTWQFIILTFSIAVLSWAICEMSGLFGLTIEDAPWLYVFVAIAGLSPTIASYVILKRNGAVKGLRGWLHTVFDVRSPLKFYLFVFVLIAVKLIAQIVVSGVGGIQSFSMIFVLLPATLLFGGLEEAGWRYILQPSWDKRYGFIGATVLVAIIWTLWHIPVFLPQGRIESVAWLGLFAIQILGESFALGAIIKITNNVFLAVLFHWMTNLISGMMNINEDYTLMGSLLPTVVLVIVSISAVIFFNWRRKIIG